MSGTVPPMNTIIAAVAAIARLSCWLSAETNIPVASEKNSVLRNTNAIRQNSPALTPPMVNVIASTGKIATNP